DSIESTADEPSAVSVRYNRANGPVHFWIGRRRQTAVKVERDSAASICPDGGEVTAQVNNSVCLCDGLHNSVGHPKIFARRAGGLSLEPECDKKLDEKERQVRGKIAMRDGCNVHTL